MDIDARIAAARAELEVWREEQMRQIHAAHDARMQALLAQAREQMEEQLDRALAVYRRSLEQLAERREESERRSPEIAAQMQHVWARTEESLTRGYDGQVELIKAMYRQLLGIA